MKIIIKSPSSLGPDQQEWGDYYLGRSLTKYLQRHGVEVETHYYSQWSKTNDADAVIALRSKYRYRPTPGTVNLLWCISPSAVTTEECAGFDQICVASRNHAATLQKELDVPVHVLLRCTDPEEFERHIPDTQRSGVIFVGNSRGIRRDCVLWAVEYGLDVQIYGRNWNEWGLKDHVVADHAPKDKLADLYARTKIALNDHRDEMKRMGYVNNRLFDCLAAGLPILSDDFPEVREICGNDILYYNDRASFEEAMEELLLSYQSVAERARKLWWEIASKFSFESRAVDILSILSDATSPGRRVAVVKRLSRHRTDVSYADLVKDPPASEGQLLPMSEEETELYASVLRQQPKNHLVSVIMPTWNRADQIEDAIQSVRRQSYGNWELLVVDDGSQDHTAEVVRGLMASDSRIKYTEINHLGVSSARDVGLERARGEIIAYLDSDNQWHADYLLFMTQAILTSGRRCAYSILRIVDHDNNKEVSFRNKQFDHENLLKNNYIDINAFAHRAELSAELGGFDRELRRWVDWDLILRYTKIHQPAQVPIPLCDYRRERKLKQITSEEPQAFKFKVLNDHLIDWTEQKESLDRRRQGHVTIVILNYKRPDLTEKCVSSILQNTRYPEYDILVVDNGSRDDSRKTLQRLAEVHSRVSFMENYENHGFALGNNIGAARAQGQLIVWLNNDVEVTENWLEALIRPLLRDESIGIVGPKMLYPDDTLQQGGLAFHSRSKISFHIYQGLPGDAACINRPRFFQAIGGAGMALRAADIIELKGFDPLYMNGCEDLDFCFRMRKELGKKVLYYPRSVIYHYEGKSPGRSKHIMYNRRLFVSRWRDQVIADDTKFFAEDGFVVTGYEKRGSEPDSEVALYYPLIRQGFRLPEVQSQNSETKRFKAQVQNQQKVLNVGFVCMWYVRGIALHAKQYADTLQGDSIKTHIFARWEDDKFNNTGSIYHPSVFKGGDDPEPQLIVDWAKVNELDLVIFMEVHPKDWRRVQALKEAGFRVMCYENLDILRRELFDRYSIFDHFLFATFYSWEVFKAKFPGLSGLLIPWGVPLPKEQGVGKYARRVDEPVRFVHIAGWGGVNNRKNTDTLIKAFHEANCGNSILHLYTQAESNKYGPDCARILSESQSIKVHQGTIDNILDAYQDMDMLLWPSKREGLGLPIVESLACGVPALVSNGYMMKQWIIPGEHGVVCPAEEKQDMMFLPELEVDVSVLADMIRDLASNPDRIQAMKESVRRDRKHWIWSWQKEVFKKQIRRIVHRPQEDLPADLSYLPRYVIDFEQRRRHASMPAIRSYTHCPTGSTTQSPCSGSTIEANVIKQRNRD